jgi:hypothetical protein
MIAVKERPHDQLPPEALNFYRQSMTALQAAGVPFLVGGAYAFARYTGIVRHTKDLDLFVHPRDSDRALEELKKIGCSVELSFPHWLGKAYCGGEFIDLIFSSGNGIARVDDLWFRYSVDEEVLGLPAKLCPAEEMIWSKSFILERERYDGADVAHLLRARADDLDWDRLVSRFGSHWPVLLSHLILFGYIYPDEAERIPPGVMAEFLGRLRINRSSPAAKEHICGGTLLSRSQFLVDIEQWGYRDARQEPLGAMNTDELAIWTKAAEEEVGRSYTKVDEETTGSSPAAPSRSS